jgi:ATP-dependent Clp protease ATP-binding subunit ClpA
MANKNSTPSLDSFLSMAFDYAHKHRSDHLGITHLLAALVQKEDSTSAQLLAEYGVTLATVEQILGASEESENSASGVVMTPRVHTVIGMARGIALTQERPANSLDVLHALLSEGSSSVEAIWESVGIVPKDALDSLAKWRAPSARDVGE